MDALLDLLPGASLRAAPGQVFGVESKSGFEPSAASSQVYGFEPKSGFEPGVRLRASAEERLRARS